MMKASLGVALALALPMAAFATTTDVAKSSPKPPTHLKKVGDHWTPWDPPTPADGDQVYIILKGDTLWDLAEKDLNDPYLWPQIWDLNRYVLDSHWIYPGDPLVMPGPVTVIADETTPPDVEPGEGDGSDGSGYDDSIGMTALMPEPDPSGRPRGQSWGKTDPDAAADHTDLMCSGYILPERWQSDAFIYAAEEEHKAGQGPGDVLYMNQGHEDGVRAGDKYYVVHQENKVKHPVTGKNAGYFVRKMAVAQVMVTQAETATVEIIDGCETVHLGFDLIPFSDLESPRRRDTDLARYGVEDNGNLSGHVLFLGPELLTVGEGHIVYLDVGQADGVKVGDYFMVYREEVTRQQPNEYGLKRWQYRHRSSIPAFNTRKEVMEKGKEIPRKMLGEVVVLAMNDNTATAKVMNTFREIYPGDQIQLLD